MKKIKVKPIFGGHQIYQEIVNYPPSGVEYVGVSGETKGGKYYESKKSKETLGRWMQKLHVPRMLPVRSGNFDLVHSSRGIIPITRKSWVMDVEHVHSFFGLNPDFIKKKFWKRFIEKRIASKNCKAILCHCEATRQAFFHYLDCLKFKDKIKVLYPSSHITKINKKSHKKIRLLAILSLFEQKGGPQILKTFSMLEKKYDNVELWIKADVPERLKKKYNSENIKYFNFRDDIIPREDLLKKFHAQCDIFLYPTFCDSFGYSLIDAMVAKLPIVGTNMYAVPEMVEDGKNGFVVKIPGYDLEAGYIQSFPHSEMKDEVEKKFVQNCYDALAKLIESKSLRARMGESGFGRINKGDLSIDKRNEKLRKIYEDAIK